jgi:hypothetical protein
VDHPIDRPARQGSLFEENIWEVKRWWEGGVDALLLENQAISEYTMRVFNHHYCRPHYVLLTNIRRDHIEELGSDLRRHAPAFGRSVPAGSVLISGEADPELTRLLRRATERVGADFVDAAPAGDRPTPPGYENVLVLDAFLRLSTGRGMGGPALADAFRGLSEDFQWQSSALPEVKWFDGSAINDVDSTRAIHRFLQHGEELPTTFVAYFRADRPARTATFRDLFRAGFSEGWCERVVLVGHGARLVARALNRAGVSGSQVLTLPDELDSVEPLMEILGRECQGGAVMTVGNAVPPWPRKLIEHLSSPATADAD